jgi:UDP-N-acetylglucosamine--N-acetylmuramyl-(pentapeptide) pyrophosphoryl-undecaprenol N-acetylglucosamine transferase
VERGLPKGVCVLWATGKAHFDAYKHLDRPDVRVLGYISPIAEAYATADLALVRGGMMGTSELCAWGVPMVIVPLPTAAQDHQTANARAMEAAGAARVLVEGEMSVEALDRVVGGVLGDSGRLREMSEAALRRGRPGAAAEIAAYLGAWL